mgnify:CR=1 FL=1
MSTVVSGTPRCWTSRFRSDGKVLSGQQAPSWASAATCRHFVRGPKKAGAESDRKTLADPAVRDLAAFGCGPSAKVPPTELLNP